MTQGLQTELYAREPQQPGPPAPVASGQPQYVPPNNNWPLAAVILVVAVAIVAAGGVLNAHLREAAREDAREAAATARIAAVTRDAQSWVRSVTDRDGLDVVVRTCEAVLRDSPMMDTTEFLEGVDQAIGGVLVEAEPAGVAEKDGAYFVTFDGDLASGDPVTFTVRVISEHGLWWACGLGGPDQFS
jgi:hypothetical protein